MYILPASLSVVLLWTVSTAVAIPVPDTTSVGQVPRQYLTGRPIITTYGTSSNNDENAVTNGDTTLLAMKQAVSSTDRRQDTNGFGEDYATTAAPSPGYYPQQDDGLEYSATLPVTPETTQG